MSKPKAPSRRSPSSSSIHRSAIPADIEPERGANIVAFLREA